MGIDKMKTASRFIMSMLSVILLTGCVASFEKQVETINIAAAEDRTKNAQISLAMGERNFDAEMQPLLKSFLTTFSQFNMAVLNIDQDIGYMVAEGDAPIDPDTYETLAKRNVDRLNEIIGSETWVYTPGNFTVRATVNIIEKQDNLLTAKVGFSANVSGDYQAKSHELPYFFTEAMYTRLWAEIDKQLFIYQETSG
jgi:hypothetical protein